jgi:glutamate-1-semialdehyde 2,1-aminomutase
MPNPFHPEAREQSVRAKTARSHDHFIRSRQSLAGGVSTALRRTARPHPLFFTHGQGPLLYDADGNHYCDYTLAWGPLLLGHAPPAVNAAVARQLELGHTYGAQHELEFHVAELLCASIPCAARVAYANSGTEIVQVALRLARAVTGRPLYLKFEGHYHGWDDSVLVSYKPTADQIASGIPAPAGLGQRPHDHVVVARWNHEESVEQAFAQHPGAISAILCEPLLANSGCIPPEPGFLEFLRRTATRHGALLIFDEVITGFRLALGGAEQFYHVTPDLATFAKAAAAGLPLSVLAGKAEYMEWIADGRVVHAGTLNGNPLSLAATRATLQVLRQGGHALYESLHARGNRIRQALLALFSRHAIPACATGEGTVFQIHLLPVEPREYRDTMPHDKALYSDFLLALLDEGILALPDGRWYISTAHDDETVDATIAILDKL